MESNQTTAGFLFMTGLQNYEEAYLQSIIWRHSGYSSLWREWLKTCTWQTIQDLDHRGSFIKNNDDQIVMTVGKKR